MYMQQEGILRVGLCRMQVLALRAPHGGGPFMISTETLPAIIRGYTRCGPWRRRGISASWI